MTRRGARFVMLAFVMTASAVIAAPPALAGTQGGTKPPRPDPTRLWSTFPLKQRAQPAGQPKTSRESVVGQPRAPVALESSGSSTFPLLLAVVTLLGGTVAVLLAVALLRSAPSLHGRGGRTRSVARLPLRLQKGSRMANLRRKLRARAETLAPLEPAEEQTAGKGGRSTSAAERTAAYSAKESKPVPVEDSAGAPAEPVVEEPHPGVEVPADLAVVGEEVGTVLRSAQEAAARILRKAHEEAERLSADSASAAAAEVEEARRIAESERADASRVRAEAETHAKDARAGADAFAEQRRSEAERRAAEIVGQAQKRAEAASAKVEQEVAQAGAKARKQRDALQVEIRRYEERIESMLIVFHGMSSQLEELLGRRQAESVNDAEASDEELEDALRPDRSSSRVG